MWPFSKKARSASSIPKRELEELFDIIAQKWLAFSQLQFKADVTLEDKVVLFMEPALEGLLKIRPAIGFLPPEVVMLIFANGLIKARTHSALEIQDALGIPRSE